jgi:DNA-binding transcriptional MerR regulator
VTSHALPRSYSIKEAAALTGLPASTLRYYEQIGVIAPISRGARSGHRVYDDEDLDQLMWVSCLAATGMSVSDMRLYMANNRLGADVAADQERLLREQQERLTTEARALVLRQRYVDLKIAYWQAVQQGDTARSEQVSDQARALADELRAVTHDPIH